MDMKIRNVSKLYFLKNVVVLDTSGRESDR